MIPFPEIFSRNKGLISSNEQQLLANTTVAIAGAGGDGGLLAERLTRFGIGSLILADPENFEPANINRQFAATSHSIGSNKARTVADELLKINPGLQIKVYDEGITPSNIRQIVGQADVIVDEIEYSLPALSVLLHGESRAQNKHVFMGANIGWGASVFCFSPTGKTFEEHFEYDAQTQTINPLKYLKEQPTYFTPEQAHQILNGNMPMPTLSSSVALVAASLSTEILLFLTGRRMPLITPDFLFIDLFNHSIQS